MCLCKYQILNLYLWAINGCHLRHRFYFQLNILKIDLKILKADNLLYERNSNTLEYMKHAMKMNEKNMLIFFYMSVISMCISNNTKIICSSTSTSNILSIPSEMFKQKCVTFCQKCIVSNHILSFWSVTFKKFLVCY